MIKILIFIVLSIGSITQLLSQNSNIKLRSHKKDTLEDENIDLSMKRSNDLSTREERSLNKKRRSKRMQNEIQFTMNNLAKIDKYFIDNVQHFEMISYCHQKLAQLKNDFDLIGFKEIEALRNLETASNEFSRFQQTNENVSLFNDDFILLNKENDLFMQNDLKEKKLSSRINSSNTSSQVLDNIKKQLIDYLK